MRFAGRILALLLVALAAASLVGGCGGDDEADRVSGGRDGNQVQAKGGEKEAAAEDDAEDEGDEAEGRNNEGDREQSEGEAAEEIKESVNAFFTATSRANFPAACSLFSPDGLEEFGGRRGCIGFFKDALGEAGAGRLKVSKVALTEKGEAAIVSLRTIGPYIEMQNVDGEWLLEEVAGY